MIYCLGYAENYDQLPVGTKKSGAMPEENYPGGSVWRTAGEARNHANVNPGFAVYALDADWHPGVNVSEETEPGCDWHNLLINTTILGKVLQDGSLESRHVINDTLVIVHSTET